MICDLRLYKFYDADLMMMEKAGLPVTFMMQQALYYFARGQRAQFYIPELKHLALSSLHEVMHLTVSISDPLSINVLEKQVSYRQRAALLRALVRQSLTAQQIGIYLSDSETMKLWWAKLPKAAPSNGPVFVYEYPPVEQKAPAFRPKLKKEVEKAMETVRAGTEHISDHAGTDSAPLQKQEGPAVQTSPAQPAAISQSVPVSADAAGSHQPKPVQQITKETVPPFSSVKPETETKDEDEEQDSLFQGFTDLMGEGIF